MGVEMQKVTLKWDEDTVRFSDELQGDFAPFAANRSHLSRIVYRIVHGIVRTRGTVQILCEHMQGSLRPTSSDAQMEFEFPPLAAPAAVAGPGAKRPTRMTNDVRPRVISINQRSKVLGTAAYASPSFPGGLRRIFASKFSRRGAA